MLIQDYRDTTGGPYDAIASLEMGEHVGADGYPAFCAALHGLLRPGGRLLIQQMSRGRNAPGGGAFIESYVAADMHMRPVGETVGLLEDAGLEVLGVQAMRPHYVRTIRAWLDNLEREPARGRGHHRAGSAPGCGGCTWRAARWRSKRAGWASTRSSRRGANDGGPMFCLTALVTACALLALVAVAFVIGARTGRHSVMDVAWGAGDRGGGRGELPRVDRARRPRLAAGRWRPRRCSGASGSRWHVAVRARGAGEDPRYRELLDRAPGNRNWYALRMVYLPQLLILWVACLPLTAGMTTSAAAGPITVIGGVVWLVGFVFEVVGDWQLTRFRADPANKGQLMDRGLWRYTRHPNYFGDACMWWGLFGLSYGSPIQLVTVVSPLLMTFILTRGTGQRMTDRRMAGIPPRLRRLRRPDQRVHPASAATPAAAGRLRERGSAQRDGEDTGEIDGDRNRPFHPRPAGAR